ncbi:MULTISPECIES: TrbI/VirB10 family protein [unclassified Mesorhizobium]|uniref:TrbI/VirB10 family protein n=1 Tax=unclassified Mesorhizobium TaxID=325217 RepID=UPI001127A886|nr:MULTISPECIES: TrbI/VirB10 family protein [unclassified Mesorhizobium]TPJ39691.1 TrbI/VirB10 family protein [Mesorhizobium sp. B2-6-6]MCA0008772.1 TrbI/VirB10 family protein [Mesorhizobium sp. B264B1B]MCA0022577.1 TrbI/VirB10 family protein [Mesorhizobium sp. B264B1A]MCA0024610.1 TrbI/VirB10 family protein [Mesorhizobium sp. B263B1A]MCA0055718.1 TrbI/VirB10 family protein [Mesorhizobium sp. B261B1A]
MSENEIPAAPMQLRADPPRVTRLSRKVLAGIGLCASLGVGGALIYALRTSETGRHGDELYSTSNRQPAEGLASLPRDYTGPVLGPPLPGDLGRPMLDAQNKGQPVVPPTIATPMVDEAEQRRRAEEEAARTSRVFFQTGQSIAALAETPPAGTSPPNLGGPDLAGQIGQSTTQDRQLGFLNAAADRRTVAPDRVTPPASPYVLQAGAVIPAALITGIRSDLPGQITAQVIENVYDSPTGRSLLIPQGTRVIGQYDNGVGFGQRRVLLVWNRLVFPNGRSIVLERQPGTDAQGYAGLEDGVDYHWAELFKAAALTTILSVGAEAGSSGQEGDIVRALRSGASDSLSQMGQQIVQRQLNIAPTLTIRPGVNVRVVVTRDLVLEPYGG